MHLKKKVAAIVLAGGSATRFGASVNKVYLSLNEKPVINYSLEAFDSIPEIDEIILVIRRGDEAMTAGLMIRKPFRTVYGGTTRKESVYNGITATNADIVLVHDGARPFLRSYYITDCLKAMDRYAGATIAVHPKDTVKLSYENHLVMRTTNRSNTWLVQTPQCFYRDVLIEAHQKYRDADVTDDCTLLEMDKRPVFLILGDDTNIKLTTKSDLILAERIIAERDYL